MFCLSEEWEDVDDDDTDDDGDDEETAMEEEGGAEATASATPHPAALPGSIPVTGCLFCPQRSRSLMKNVAHMTKAHSFFIPDVEFLVDLKGLIGYLGELESSGDRETPLHHRTGELPLLHSL